jgi:DNA-binding transcriptional ArsR family regulator
MGITKSNIFSSKQNELAKLSKALGHPARVAIIEYLLKQDACICGSIAETIPLAQATVSQHLKELKLAGLIKGNIEGNSICYCLNIDTWKKFKQLLEPIFGKI